MIREKLNKLKKSVKAEMPLLARIGMAIAGIVIFVFAVKKCMG